MQLSLIKCHGSGNDFLLLDETLPGNGGLEDAERSQLSRTLCERSRGVGGDGMLYYQSSHVADCRMRMFNPDGSEAEMCGNGLRCIARYAAEQLGREELQVETAKATLKVRRQPPLAPGVATFEVEIGPLSLTPAALPMALTAERFHNQPLPELSSELRFSALAIPNPHLVGVASQIDPSEVARIGAAANRSPLFPRGVNLSLLRPLGKNSIFVMTYERGVGITDSCGTAMSASAYVSMLHQISRIATPITVYNRGGMVLCEIVSEQGPVLLKGNATFLFEIELELNDSGSEILQRTLHPQREAEIAAYRSLQERAAATAATL